MRWEYIAPPGGDETTYEGTPLLGLFKQIVKSMADVQKKRGAADKLDTLEDNRGADRSPLIQSRIAALEAEVALREDLTVFGMARGKIEQQRRHAAKAELHEVELRRREELHVPDHVKDLPIACLQTCAAWWDARQKVEAIGSTVDLGAKHTECIMHAGKQLEELRRSLAAEPGRLKRIQAQQEAEIGRQTEAVEQAAVRTHEVDVRTMRVAELLGQGQIAD